MTSENHVGLDKEEYISRCAKRLMEKAEIEERVARGIAESCWENRWYEDDFDPEGDADEELTYWGE